MSRSLPKMSTTGKEEIIGVDEKYDVKPTIKKEVTKSQMDTNRGCSVTSDAKPDIKPKIKLEHSTFVPVGHTSPPTKRAKILKPQTPSPLKGAPSCDREQKNKTAFPGFARPTRQECIATCAALVSMYGSPSQEKLEAEGTLLEKKNIRKTVLDSLVGTILSQNTTDVNSHRAFKNLKVKFPSWEDVLQANPEEVIEAIRSGGLAEIKTHRIRSILQVLKDEQGELSLEYLRDMGDDEAKAELMRFKGVGPKTVACVLMFSLARAEFPVDAHVWKIAINLGWVPPKADREATYDHLNKHVPDFIKFDLHVLLVRYGKEWRNDVGALKKSLKGIS
eukprot:CAMPEP_0114252028 /NCGR_PEP_ID=MMETSP0058-20121206/15603_1 /TAXON_ID=36894 /ORGANISM="Pyramimonas parkeae, CCMP726" /LENGTH=333 /DNA_ID=CAMNT_0001365905 /DNA_START=139 /DNA_END=1140 /DNA_ORIENTATION=+